MQRHLGQRFGVGMMGRLYPWDDEIIGNIKAYLMIFLCLVFPGCLGVYALIRLAKTTAVVRENFAENLISGCILFLKIGKGGEKSW